jgi:cysteine-rich repeat protein
MKRRLLLAAGLLASLSSACKQADSVVLVNVAIDTNVVPLYSLRVTMSSAQTHDTKVYPATASATALRLQASLVIVLPRSRSGILDLVIDGLNRDGQSVAHVTAQTIIVVGGTATVLVNLVAGSSVCGNRVIDSGETCDDGNQFSFDGCDFRCQTESAQTDAGFRDSAMIDNGNADSAAALDTDSTPRDAVEDSNLRQEATADVAAPDAPIAWDVAVDFRVAKTGGTMSAGGAAATGGTIGSGGVRGTGGTTDVGGASGTGAATAAGGTTGTGGANGTGGITGMGGTTGMGGMTAVCQGSNSNACTAGAIQCLSSTSLQTCAVDTNGCTTYTTTTCSTGQVCERCGMASCADPNWDEWPIPNSQVDVDANPGAPNPESYTDNSDGTVTDNVTSLIWQQTPPSETYTWANAVAYCTALVLAGQNDWRLPSLIELGSLVDVGQSNPSINGAIFPSTHGVFFWSASTVTSSSSNAPGVLFSTGQTFNVDVGQSGNVRCVR